MGRRWVAVTLLQIVHRRDRSPVATGDSVYCGAFGRLRLIEVDARGLRCPMPLLKAKQALNAMQVGEELRLLATDPGSRRDMRAFAEQSGHQLLESSEQDGEFCYRLRKC